MADEKNHKERILKTASDLFIKFGIRSISMDDIAQHLGMSKKTIYQYFADKDEIVTLAIEVYLANEKETLRTIREEANNTVDLLIRVNNYLRRNIKDNTAPVLHELKKYHNNAWAVLEEFRNDFMFDLIRNSIAEGIDKGYVRPEVDAEIVSRIRLQEAQIAFDEEIFPTAKFDLMLVSDNLLDHFVYGITTDKGRKLYQKHKAHAENQTLKHSL